MSHRWLIAVSGIAHVAVAAGLFASGVWHVERLHADTLPIDLRQPLSLPAPTSGGPVAPDTTEIKRKPIKKLTHDVHQPEPKPAEDPTPSTAGNEHPSPIPGPDDPYTLGTCLENCGVAQPATPVCGNSSVEAGEQCDDGNTTNGDGCSATCQAEPKPTIKQDTMVAPNVLQGLRVSGETQIRPSTVTQDQMIRAGATKVRGIVKVCIATDGSVASTTMKVSTSYSDYDATLLSAVHGWRYQPYLLNGAPVPACSLVNFIYTIK
jgi:cysteine-rich repeat protein